MIKEPITNLVGLKALAWDIERQIFVSPARPEFVWSKGGLQMSQCPKCGNNNPQENCTCGLYATFDVHIALEYIHYSIISPIFLVEASGDTFLHECGYRCGELTLHGVAPNCDEYAAKLAASQASDYFQVQPMSLEKMLIIQDIVNRTLIPEYYCRTDLIKGLSTEVLKELMEKNGVNL